MKRFLMGLLLAIPALSCAQSNFLEGFYVNNSKDTVRGYVDYRARIQDVTTLRFKSSKDGAVQTLTVENCAAYGVDGHERFERYKVNISQGPTKTEQLKVGLDSSLKTAVVFLKILQNGPNVTLYSYTDDIKQRFYLKEAKSTEIPYELIKIRYIESSNSNKIISRDRYKGQLMFEYGKYNTRTPAFDDKVDESNYTETDIIKIVSAINDAKIQYENKKTRFFVGLGIANTSPSYTGSHVLSNSGAVKTGSSMPAFSVGADLFNSSSSERWIYRAELFAFTGKDLKVENAQTIHSFDHLTFLLNPKVLVNLYNTDILKVYLGVGGGVNYTTFSNNRAGKVNAMSESPDQLDEVEVVLSAISVSYNFNAGFLINKRYEVSAMYTPPYSIAKYTAYDIRLGIIQAGIKYHFGKH